MIVKTTIKTNQGDLDVETHYQRNAPWYCFWVPGTHTGTVSGDLVATGRTNNLRQLERKGETFDSESWKKAAETSYPLPPQRGYKWGRKAYHKGGIKSAERFIAKCCNGHLNHNVFAETLYAQ